MVKQIKNSPANVNISRFSVTETDTSPERDSKNPQITRFISPLTLFVPLEYLIGSTRQNHVVLHKFEFSKAGDYAV